MPVPKENHETRRKAILYRPIPGPCFKLIHHMRKFCDVLDKTMSLPVKLRT
jgi:hypothetical protein